MRFQLNHASAKQTGNQFTEREYSIWVSDLPTEITEEDFKKTFSTRFESLKTAKIFREKDHKVYGFVRFTDLNDQREALIHMNGFLGLGEKPIRYVKICNVTLPNFWVCAQLNAPEKRFKICYLL